MVESDTVLAMEERQAQRMYLIQKGLVEVIQHSTTSAVLGEARPRWRFLRATVDGEQIPPNANAPLFAHPLRATTLGRWR